MLYRDHPRQLLVPYMMISLGPFFVPLNANQLRARLLLKRSAQW